MDDATQRRPARCWAIFQMGVSATTGAEVADGIDEQPQQRRVGQQQRQHLIARATSRPLADMTKDSGGVATILSAISAAGGPAAWQHQWGVSGPRKCPRKMSGAEGLEVITCKIKVLQACDDAKWNPEKLRCGL